MQGPACRERPRCSGGGAEIEARRSEPALGGERTLMGRLVTAPFGTDQDISLKDLPFSWTVAAGCQPPVPGQECESGTKSNGLSTSCGYRDLATCADLATSDLLMEAL